MDKGEFLTDLAEAFQMDTSPAMTTVLKDMERWDSLTMMLFIAYADAKCGKKLILDSLACCATVTDLYNLVAE
jgi:hypothetical protein